MAIPQKVAIVGDGASHIMPREKYKAQAEDFVRSLNRKMTGLGEKQERKFEASVVDSWQQALEGPLKHTTGSALVFISNTFLHEAKELAPKLKQRGIKVYVITGLPPDDEPVILDKAWISSTSLADLIN